MNDHLADLRISGLAVHFREIGDTQMRELPFYNASLEVEAVDFSRLGDDQLIGVLITPWFMNLVLLPLNHAAVDADRYGRCRSFALPGGGFDFRYGGDEVVGAFWAHSLHSPMQKFTSQAQARGEARVRLAAAVKSAQTEGRATSPSRRAFLTGGRSSEARR
jgi:[NiFe] hydrogenase assembly HybE family chaperone